MRGYAEQMDGFVGIVQGSRQWKYVCTVVVETSICYHLEFRNLEELQNSSGARDLPGQTSICRYHRQSGTSERLGNTGHTLHGRKTLPSSHSVSRRLLWRRRSRYLEQVALVTAWPGFRKSIRCFSTI